MGWNYVFIPKLQRLQPLKFKNGEIISYFQKPVPPAQFHAKNRTPYNFFIVGLFGIFHLEPNFKQQLVCKFDRFCHCLHFCLFMYICLYPYVSWYVIPFSFCLLTLTIQTFVYVKYPCTLHFTDIILTLSLSIKAASYYCVCSHHLREETKSRVNLYVYTFNWKIP